MYEPIVDKFKYVPESALIELCFKSKLQTLRLEFECI